MQYVKLGYSGIKVSRLCFGTMNLGKLVDEKDSMLLLSEAEEKGINFFDTANVYGGKDSKGLTEEIIGKWINKKTCRRDDIIIATKAFGKIRNGINNTGLSVKNIKRSCEESLKRLGTDYIDLYQMHHVDLDTTWDEVWQALEILIQEGKILYAGSSNFAAWQLIDANSKAKSKNMLGFVSEQSIYNLSNRTVELEVIPACNHFNIAVLPYSPLGSGLLASVPNDNNSIRRSSENIKNELQNNRTKIEEYRKFCENIGYSQAEIALAWLYKQNITAPIIGVRNLEQLNSAIKSLEIDLCNDDLKKLDEIWPGPGGKAPEAYAW